MISKSIFSFTVLLLGIVPGTRVLAADMPKEFSFSVAYTNSGTAKVVQQGTGSARTVDHILIATNDAGRGFLHNVTAYCVGMSYNDQDQPPKGGGACTFTDADGDQLFERYTLTKPAAGEIRFIGGTGKYAGIQCQGEWERIAQPKAVSEGHVAKHRKEKRELQATMRLCCIAGRPRQAVLPELALRTPAAKGRRG